MLIDELFRTAHEETLDNVETEAHLPGGSETTRYEDILISYPGGGISIEVKIGDTNLRKTVETAALVERHHSGDWTHVLLLPTYQHPQLRDTFGEALIEPAAGPPIITATPFGNQEVEIQVRTGKRSAPPCGRSSSVTASCHHTERRAPTWSVRLSNSKS